MLLRRHGILQQGHARKDSVSAAHRFALHRARNDFGKAANQSNGFGMTSSLRIACAQLNPVVGDLPGNAAMARAAWEEAHKQNAALLVFPELFVSGYPPEDLVLKPAFVQA